MNVEEAQEIPRRIDVNLDATLSGRTGSLQSWHVPHQPQEMN